MKSAAKNTQCYRLIFSEYEEPFYYGRFYEYEESKRHYMICLPIGLHLKFLNMLIAKVKIEEFVQF